MKSLFNHHIGMKDYVSFRDYCSASRACSLILYLTLRRSWSPVKIFTRAYRETPTLWILHQLFCTTTSFILTCGIYYPLDVRWQKIWVIWAVLSHRLLRTLQLICIPRAVFYFLLLYVYSTTRPVHLFGIHPHSNHLSVNHNFSYCVEPVKSTQSSSEVRTSYIRWL